MIMVFFVDYGLRSKLMIALVECMYQAISQLLGRVLKRETFDSQHEEFVYHVTQILHVMNFGKGILFYF